jgi:ribosomal protein S18 acetylase RimI-like enzyme
MIIRKSSIKDLSAIMKIITDAQHYLASLHIDQWQDGYPDATQIKLDIKNNDSYIIINESNKIIGTTVFTTKTEQTYNKIEGEWLTQENAKYGVIHRLAVDNDFRKVGLAKFVFEQCEAILKQLGIKSMRIDTHRDNKGMQGLITKLGYSYCGVIFLESGAERLAYEKMLN